MTGASELFAAPITGSGVAAAERHVAGGTGTLGSAVSLAG